MMSVTAPFFPFQPKDLDFKEAIFTSSVFSFIVQFPRQTMNQITKLRYVTHECHLKGECVLFTLAVYYHHSLLVGMTTVFKDVEVTLTQSADANGIVKESSKKKKKKKKKSKQISTEAVQETNSSEADNHNNYIKCNEDHMS
ncbi:hypothetical protein CEXT_664411 [Caerostris extrusa]|uniref:Uncharacterized protein n=1 Tax=Caerostris extrusa TaxID=172846 RepID=A0AAV4SZK0_CAEEX|nr:hypothetical protein CEXT_664411 [Caerostris extrusa]